MANDFGWAKEGLMETLRHVKGLHVYSHTAEGLKGKSCFPAAVVKLKSREPVDAVEEGIFRGEIMVEALACGATEWEAYNTLEAFLEPTGDCSIEAAVKADSTWKGKVDEGQLAHVSEIGSRSLSSLVVVGADFYFTFEKRLGQRDGE